MASKTVMVDDIDGSTEGVETIIFQIAGERRAIDLGEDQRFRLMHALEPYLKASRPLRGASRVRSDEAAQVRAWATERGIPVGVRGRVSKSLIDAYREAKA